MKYDWLDRLIEFIKFHPILYWDVVIFVGFRNMSYLEIYLSITLLVFCTCELFVCLIFMRASQHLACYFYGLDALRIDQQAKQAGIEYERVRQENMEYKHNILPTWTIAREHLLEFDIQKLYQLRHQIMEKEGMEDVEQRSA